MRKKLKAFTIVEITIVLGIMSLIVALITYSYNRFNEQLKKSVELNDELNGFYAFRSNLWNELYQSDSVRFEKDEVFIYRNNSPVQYRINQDYLERRVEGDWKETNFEMDNLTLAEKNNEQFIQFDFLWKDQVMRLEYLIQSSLKNEIDTYFDRLNDR